MASIASIKQEKTSKVTPSLNKIALVKISSSATISKEKFIFLVNKIPNSRGNEEAMLAYILLLVGFLFCEMGYFTKSISGNSKTVVSFHFSLSLPSFFVLSPFPI